VAIKTGESHAAVAHVIDEVKRFVAFHFASEENLMRETNYPQLLTHQALHADLLTELGVLATKVIAHREFPEDLLFFSQQVVSRAHREPRSACGTVHTQRSRPADRRAHI
jgi:hemerythrin-like metal-binding protein